MNDIRKFILDEKPYDFIADTKKEIERQRANRIASNEISKKLRPIVEKIYSDASLPSPFKEYINTKCEPI